MPGLTIGWEYLTGRCVATDPASRKHAEWPPHPGRVFMALAAAHFETGKERAEAEALRWLETLGDPELGLPDFFSRREVVDCYVPVNDVAGPSTAILQSASGLTRGRKERTFPTVWVGDAFCFLRWPDADPEAVEGHRSALELLCAKVTRIGHSSSLVRMWVADEMPSTGSMETWIPDDQLAELRARRVSEGTLDLLDRHFKARDPIRPKLGFWTGYRNNKVELTPSVQHTNFDTDLLILTKVEGPQLPLESSLAATRALRGAIMAHIVSDIPDWVSGHKPNSEPLRNDNQQMAQIPLPFIGSEYADGHLMGLGLIFPRSISRAERGRALGSLLLESSGQPRTITLTLGALGVWKLIKRDWTEARLALKPETWTANAQGSTTWATVTPMVLDRFPKCDMIREREGWESEVAGIITKSCVRLGLPEPLEIRFGTTSWQLGSPRAIGKRRRLRGHSELPVTDAALGDGFPIYPAKGGNGARPQLHVCVRFAKPVVGPILLGAGRFLGYGLCKPLRGGVDR